MTLNQSIQAAVLGPPLGLTPTVYHIGNSLTRGLSLGTGSGEVDRVDALFTSAGGNYRYGSELAAGARLDQHYFQKLGSYNNLKSADGFTGNYTTVLQSQRLDALILQPYQQHLNSGNGTTYPTGDRQSVKNFITYAMGGNPASFQATNRFYLYATWPRLDGMTGMHYTDFWNSNYNPSASVQNAVASRDFFTQLIIAARQDSPQAEIGMIPVGEVFNTLDSKIRQGTLPGFQTWFEAYQQLRFSQDPAYSIRPYTPDDGVKLFYVDNIHMNPTPHNGDECGTIGAYVASLTLFSTLTGSNPLGFDTSPYETLDPVRDAALINELQRTVWDVVSTSPYTGVPEPGTIGVIAGLVGLGVASARCRNKR